MTKQNLFVIGYPRSGNVWLARLLGRILDSEISSGGGRLSIADEGQGRNGKYVIRQRHSRQKVDGLVIFIYRDPRDVAISAMFYWGYKSLAQMFTSENKTIRVLPDDTVGGWANFMTMWLEDFGVDAIASYEGLHSDALIELKDVLELIGEDIPDEKVLDAIEREAFINRRRLIQSSHDHTFAYGKTIQLKHMRRGVIGEWKNYFTSDVGEMVHDHWWYWLEKLGYEDNPDWWKEL